MKSNVENVSNLQRKLNIEVPAEIVQEYFKKATIRAQKESHVKGFRPGKAPLSTVKKLYSDNITQWATNDLINSHFIKGIMEHKLQIAGDPEFEFGWPVEGEKFEFSAYFEVYPEVKLAKIDGLGAEKLKVQVTEKEVSETIERLRNSWAEWTPKEGAAEKGDQVTFDFTGEIEGKSEPRLSGQGLKVELGSHQLIEGFESGLEGLKAGDKKSLSLQFPIEYHSEDFAGKPVTFHVEVKSVSSKVLPELNDEFAKKFGKETLRELKDLIFQDLSQRIEKESNRHFEETLIRSLVASNPIEVPQYFVKRQKEHLIKNLEQDWKQRGQPDSEIQAYIQKWDSDFEKLAQEMIQAEFLVMEVAKLHNLEATEADFESKMKDYADQTGIELSRVLEYYSEETRKTQVMTTITRQKVVKFLSEKANVTEIDKIKETSLQ
jgi:trigger factor